MKLDVKEIVAKRFSSLDWSLNQHEKKIVEINTQKENVHDAQSIVFFSSYNLLNINDALSSGARVFVVDSNLDKIQMFLALENVKQVLEHPFFELLCCDHERAALILAKKIIPDTCTFIGKDSMLESIKNSYFECILTLADQKDFFSKKIYNIQKNLLQFPTYYDFNALENSYLNQNVILLGSGPSLLNSISWIKEHQHKYVVIAAGSSIFKLESEGIKPDFLVYLDPKPLVKKQKFEKFVKTPLFMSLRSSHEFLLLHKGKKILVPELSSSIQSWYKKELGLNRDQVNIGCSSGSMAAVVCKHLGFTKAYCFGFDAETKLDYKKAKAFMIQLESETFKCLFNELPAA